MAKGKSILVYSTLVILGVYFLFLGLSKAQSFLIPLVTAIILALLMVPLSNKMENHNVNRALASFLNTFLLLLIATGFLVLLSFQVKNLVEDWDKMKSTLQPKIEQLKDFVLAHTPLERKDLKTSGEGGKDSSLMASEDTSTGKRAAKFFKNIMGFFADFLLTFIYIFFLLNYRKRFKKFLLRLFPDDKRKEVKEVINKSAKVTQKYLVGKLILIGILAALYALGLGITGIKNFILVSVIAALFSLIPYIGNIIGFLMALAFGYLSSGDTSVLIGVVITFGVAQFVESYILEPYIVGDQVDLHPFFVILSVVIGGMVWGIMGMILAIPVLAIFNVVFLNISVLRPFGFLFGKDTEES